MGLQTKEVTDTMPPNYALHSNGDITSLFQSTRLVAAIAVLGRQAAAP